MARKRMFDLDIINQDSFYDLPMEAKAIYFLLGMEADDEGFINPKKILRLYGGNEDSVKILILKNYIIPFKSGEVVITDWKRNNYLQKDRIKPTLYNEEKKLLTYNEISEKYELFNKCLTNVNIEERRIEENRIEENRIEENRYIVEQKHDVAKQIIDYLNLKTNKKFKYTKNNISKIETRLKDFNEEDFKIVIDKKCSEWLKDNKMNCYLRPETLFGNKFESYLNQKVNKTLKDISLEEIEEAIKCQR